MYWIESSISLTGAYLGLILVYARFLGVPRKKSTLDSRRCVLGHISLLNIHRSVTTTEILVGLILSRIRDYCWNFKNSYGIIGRTRTYWWDPKIIYWTPKVLVGLFVGLQKCWWDESHLYLTLVGQSPSVPPKITTLKTTYFMGNLTLIISNNKWSNIKNLSDKNIW